MSIVPVFDFVRAGQGIFNINARNGRVFDVVPIHYSDSDTLTITDDRFGGGKGFGVFFREPLEPGEVSTIVVTVTLSGNTLTWARDGGSIPNADVFGYFVYGAYAKRS